MVFKKRKKKKKAVPPDLAPVLKRFWERSLSRSDAPLTPRQGARGGPAPTTSVPAAAALIKGVIAMATSVTLSNRWPIIIHSFTVYCSDGNHNELQECINGDVI